ncbi:MAG: 23S rRNA (uracil(1939)-C(5))-methyltransferase RlmD [Parachlamydiaceae bacterium]|nr:23S rRNA (uracil(1939)-C(5))-methyltransferase RlmD [Parachlamydiaceae bacterium]
MILEVGQEYDLIIDRLGVNGEGVANLGGFVLFIEGALPQEKVRVKLYEKRKNFGRASIVKFLFKSESRQDPPCQLYDQCGGCQLMHFNYSSQLEFKRTCVVDAISRIAKIENAPVRSCVPSPKELAYRNKIQMPATNQSPFQLGLYARQSHDLIPVDFCHIHCDLGEKILADVKKILKIAACFSIKHVLIKTAVHTNEVLVILVTSKKDDEIFIPLGNKIFDDVPEIKGVVQNINPIENNVILSQTYRTLAGNGYIHDNMIGHRIKISAASFFQVNPLQAEQLYLKAIELCDLKKDEIALDAYCGVGTLTLALAMNAKEVIGVECVSEAIINAKENANVNHIKNVKFVCSKSEEYIQQLVSNKKKIDVALLNPPRKGCERQFLIELIKLSPQRIVYISCDPATLARDLQILCSEGYVLNVAIPFDMFPQTAHVETIVRLSKSVVDVIASS